MSQYTATNSQPQKWLQTPHKYQPATSLQNTEYSPSLSTSTRQIFHHCTAISTMLQMYFTYEFSQNFFGYLTSWTLSYRTNRLLSHNIANAGQYATSHCKLLLFWFPRKWRNINVWTFNWTFIAHIINYYRRCGGKKLQQLCLEVFHNSSGLAKKFKLYAKFIGKVGHSFSHKKRYCHSL